MIRCIFPPVFIPRPRPFFLLAVAFLVDAWFGSVLPADPLPAPVVPAQSAALPPDTLGYRQYFHRDYDGAIQSFSQAIALNPNDYTAYVNRALVKGLKQDYAGANADFTQALLLDQRYFRLNYFLSSNRPSDEKNPDFPTFLASVTATLTSNPQNAAALLFRTFIKYATNDYAGALADCNLALAADPNSADAFNLRGLVEQNRQPADRPAALADFTQAITLDPRFTLAHLNRASVYLQQGINSADQAIADFSQAINLDPHLAAAFRGRGNAKRYAHDLPAAIADENQAIALNANDFAAYAEIENSKMMQKDYDGAIAACNRILALNPRDPNALRNRAEAELNKPDLDAAIADCTAAIARNPRDPNAYEFRADAETKKQDYDDAIADYTQLATFGEVWISYNRRAQVEILRKNYDDAIADCSTAIAQYPKNFYLYQTRAQAEQGKGDITAATADFAQAHALNPRMGQ
jgi:tetratricopeptide (TPR) repeat protein